MPTPTSFSFPSPVVKEVHLIPSLTFKWDRLHNPHRSKKYCQAFFRNIPSFFQSCLFRIITTSSLYNFFFLVITLFIKYQTPRNDVSLKLSILKFDQLTKYHQLNFVIFNAFCSYCKQLLWWKIICYLWSNLGSFCKVSAP